MKIFTVSCDCKIWTCSNISYFSWWIFHSIFLNLLLKIDTTKENLFGSVPVDQNKLEGRKKVDTVSHCFLSRIGHSHVFKNQICENMIKNWKLSFEKWSCLLPQPEIEYLDKCCVYVKINMIHFSTFLFY